MFDKDLDRHAVARLLLAVLKLAEKDAQNKRAVKVSKAMQEEAKDFLKKTKKGFLIWFRFALCLMIHRLNALKNTLNILRMMKNE